MASTEEAVSLVSGVRPRAYQVDLFLEAQKRNVIAYLDTGTGKTLVAVLLIKEKAKHLYIGDKKSRVTIFLAPKVDLVIQQADAISTHTEFTVQHFVGSMNVDLWNAEQWRQKIRECEVMAMTPQILLNMLSHGYIAMREINLLIFDEAHHVQNKDPGNMIMQEHYRNTPKEERPHIFGMTASPLASKINSPLKLSDFLNKLEHNLDSKVITVKDRTQVETVVPSPEEMVKRYPPFPLDALQETLDVLASVATELRVKGHQVTSEVHERNLRVAGLSYADASEFEKDKHTAESTSVSRDIDNISHTLQELGPWPAASIAVDLLMPKRRTMYSLQHKLKRGKLSQDDQERMDALLGRLVPAIDDDCAWDDTDLADILGTLNHDTVGNENVVLCEEVGKAVVALVTLLGKATGQHIHVEVPRLDGDRWLDIRKEMARRLEKAVKCVKSEHLDACLAGPVVGPGAPAVPLISTKLHTMCHYLMTYEAVSKEVPGPEQRGRKWSCLIFAERKMVVLGIHRFLALSKRMSFLQSKTLMGSGGRSITAVDTKEQQLSLRKIREGVINTLVTTAIAEEGLDLTACRLVLRFNLPDNPRQFIQSRGRARARNAHFVMMLEEGSDTDSLLLAAVRQNEAWMQEEGARRTVMVDEEGPEDDYQLVNAAIDLLKPDQKEYVVPSTGARATLYNAKEMIWRYCAKLPSDRYATLRPLFKATQFLNGEEYYQAEVILPNNCAIEGARGHVMPTKRLAIASACLEAIRLLHQVGGLNDNLIVEKLIADKENELEDKEDLTLPPAMALTSAMPLKLLPDGWRRPGSNMTAVHKSARLEDLNLDTPIYGLPPSASQDLGAVQNGDVPPNASNSAGAGHPQNVLVVHSTGAGASTLSRGEVASQAVHVHVQVSFPQTSSVVTTSVTLLDNHPHAVPRAVDAPQTSGHSGGTVLSTASTAATVLSGPPPPRLPATCASNGHVGAVQHRAPAPGGVPVRRDETGRDPAGPVPRETSEMSECESAVEEAAKHTAKKGFRAEDYPDPNPMYLYEVEAELLETGDPGGPAASGGPPNGSGPAVPPATGAQPMSDGLDGDGARVREPITEILGEQPLGVLVPKLLPPVETFNIQMPGRPDCSARLRLIGEFSLPLEQRTDLARYHKVLLKGRALREADKSTHLLTSVEVQLANLLNALRMPGEKPTMGTKKPAVGTGGAGAAGPPGSRGEAPGPHGDFWADVAKYTGQEPEKKRMRKRKAGWADASGMLEEPTHEPPLLPAGYGRYTLVPLIKAGQRPRGAVDVPINWKVITQCLRGFLPCKDLKVEDLPIEETLFVTPYNAFLYRLVKIRRDVSALHPMCSANVAGDRATGKPVRGTSFAQYYKDRWDVTNINLEHPMLECQNLQRGFAAFDEETHVLLHQDICLVHPLTYVQLHLSAFAPKLLFWLQVHLMAIELRELLLAPAMPHSMVPELKRVVEALMPMACRQDVNYERLETLGDAFLKYAASLYAFTAYPRAHEGQLTARKMKIISNKTLMEKAQILGLNVFVTLNPDVYNWENGRPEGTMKFRSKMLADLVEALIGAAYCSGKEEGAFAFLAYNNICPRPPCKPPRPTSTVITSSRVPPKLQKLLKGYQWKNPLLPREAFTHCSWPFKGLACYQRLEFLGDAVLDLLISRYYILTYEDLVPGQLHDLRSASLNNNRLACVAGQKGLQCFLRHCSHHLFQEIAAFMEALKDMLMRALADVREKNGGDGIFREGQMRVGSYRGGARGANKNVSSKPVCLSIKDLQKMTDDEVLEAAYNQATAAGFGKEGGLAYAPKVMGDLVEALAGAVFLDCDCDIDKTWEVVRVLLEPLVTPTNCPIHPVRMLLEWSSKAGLPLPVFRTGPCKEEGCVSVDCVIEHPTTAQRLLLMGRCEVAPNKLTGRMISAERAVHNWQNLLPDIHRVAEWERLRRAEKLDPHVALPADVDAATPSEAGTGEKVPMEPAEV